VEGNDKKLIQGMINKNKSYAKQYVAERVPILSEKGEVKGHVVLFTKINDLQKISRVMNQTQIMSLVVGGAAAVILGMLFQSGFAKPIRKLKKHMTGFSLKDSQPELKLNTGDEIEELAECFTAMAKKLKEYDNQQKIFLQNTSHELKTPLMSIQGYAEAIKDGVVTGNEVEDSLDVIIDESKRLKKFIEEMNYLIRLENIEDTFHFERTCLQEVINQGIKSVKALLDAKGLVVKAEGDCTYEGSFDREKLARAVINILSNLHIQQGDLNRIKKVIKVLGFVASSNNFFDQPKVMNGASQLLVDIFGEENGKAARSAIGVNVLPNNQPVEVEIIFELK
jgi:signal transduction histidine kinase